MKFLYLTIIILLAFWSIPTNAQGAPPAYPRDITLSWLWPTTNVDGTLIQEGDLRGGDNICFRNNDFSVAIFDLPAPITVLLGEKETITHVGVIPRPGQYQCFATAVTVDEIMSDFSNQADKRYTGKPLPPQNFEVIDEETTTP